MSFIEPNLGQTQQNKKILQELEEKKRRMRSNTASPIQSESSILNYQTSNPTTPTAQLPIIDTSLQPVQKLPQQQPFATVVNVPNNCGYFISTDSNIGNQILPVLPRF